MSRTLLLLAPQFHWRVTSPAAATQAWGDRQRGSGRQAVGTNSAVDGAKRAPISDVPIATRGPAA